MKDNEEKAFVRSGPDGVSFVANWMTEYERTQDKKYRKKIENGLQDIYNTPLGLASGPEYEYDFEQAHLIYHGESDTSGNMHLQICMGGPEIWAELADMLDSDVLRKLLVDHGRFYYLSREEKEQETKGLIRNRPFSFYWFASSLAAYSAWMSKDEALAISAWKELLHALATDRDVEGFRSYPYTTAMDGKELKEIPWIKTNFTAQWCLNVIVALEFIREYLPETMEEMKDLLHGMEEGQHHRA